MKAHLHLGAPSNENRSVRILTRRKQTPTLRSANVHQL